MARSTLGTKVCTFSSPQTAAQIAATCYATLPCTSSCYCTMAPGQLEMFYICRAAHQVHTLKPIESEVAGWVNRQWRILMNLNGFRLVLEQFYSYPHAISYGPYAYDLNRKTPSHNSATFGSRSWLLLGGCVWSMLSTHCRMLKRAIFQMSTCPIPDLFGSFCYQ